MHQKTLAGKARANRHLAMIKYVKTLILTDLGVSV